MVKILTAFICGTFFGFLLFNMTFKSMLEPKVLAEKVEVIASATASASPTSTPTEEPTPAPTESPTPKPTVKPTKTPAPTATPTPVPTPPPLTHGEINSLMERFGSQYAVDPNILRHIALCESEFRPAAKNGAYLGLYQFGPITWQNYRKLLGEDPNVDLRANAEEAIQTAAYALSLGKRHLWPNCQP